MTNEFKITIRVEVPEDYEKILMLTYKAFLNLDYPGRKRLDEHFLLSIIRNSDSVVQGLSLVAEHEEEIVGYFYYTKSGFTRPDGSKAEAITFGPLAVSPELIEQGIGAALVECSIKKAREMGYPAVLIVGGPEYYPELDFMPAREYGLTLEDGSAPDIFMAHELTPGYLSGGGVFDAWAPEYDTAGSDDEGFAAFHRNFIEKYNPQNS